MRKEEEKVDKKVVLLGGAKAGQWMRTCECCSAVINKCNYWQHAAGRCVTAGEDAEWHADGTTDDAALVSSKDARPAANASQRGTNGPTAEARQMPTTDLV